jgi:hypothetical protein
MLLIVYQLVDAAYYNDNIFLKHQNWDQVGAAPSRVQMIAVRCQRAFAARTADTW